MGTKLPVETPEFWEQTLSQWEGASVESSNLQTSPCLQRIVILNYLTQSVYEMSHLSQHWSLCRLLLTLAIVTRAFGALPAWLGLFWVCPKNFTSCFSHLPFFLFIITEWGCSVAPGVPSWGRAVHPDPRTSFNAGPESVQIQGCKGSITKWKQYSLCEYGIEGTRFGL